MSTVDHHDHDHGHDHGHHEPIEDAAQSLHYRALERAVRELLIEKGMFGADDVRRQIDDQDSRGEAQGARLVARAWADPAYKARLLADAKPAATELGVNVAVAPELVVVENTAEVHHVVVCTLCSCYPKAILGIPPAWYKSREYRSRVVREPRAVLREFGTELPEDVEVRVVDSTADMRYLVLPRRPPGTEGWDEARLAALVSRDSMIGVAPARGPS